MKSVLVIALIVLCGTFAMADQTKFTTQLESLMNMQAKVNDALDAGLQVLLDLKQANVDSQRDADEKNKTDEEVHGRQIGQFLSIADQNKAVGDAATAHRKHIQAEIQSTIEYLQWIHNRQGEIAKRRVEYREHRCYANLLFIKSLKEHDEALEVVRWLREDILGIVKGASGQTQTALSEIGNIKDSASKLNAYVHLFDDKAMSEFNQLTQNFEEGHGAQQVSDDTAADRAGAHDNDKAGLALNRMGAGTADRDIGNKLIQAVDKLEEHLITSMRDLEKNEIQAAWDLAKWLQDTDAELVHLGEEQQVKTTYIDKLQIAIVGAKAREDEAWEIYFQSAAAYNDAVAQLQSVRAFYQQEKQRRDEENAELDEVIRIFKEQVMNLDAGMRTKVNDFSVDKVFDNSDIKRSTDDIGARDGGKLLENTDAEARAKYHY